MFKEIITKALENFFSSPAGKELIGSIMLEAVGKSMTHAMPKGFAGHALRSLGEVGQGKKVVKNQNINVIDFLARHLPSVEAAMHESGDIKQIFAEEIERRNTIDSEILSKALILSKSHVLQKMSMEDIKQIDTASLKLCSVNKNKAKDMSCKVLKK